MVMTLTRHEAEESKEMEGPRAHAEALLTLSSPTGSGGTSSAAARRAMAAEGVFECKTCSKRFPSFQALGGHRTSHTRLQARMLSDPAAAAAAAERDRARVHECAVCGLEFSMGQALGGHMRRHQPRTTTPRRRRTGTCRTSTCRRWTTAPSKTEQPNPTQRKPY
ncbi:unnamed protein product [Miscanthus lutarioriparius]|uniref:C2H2-type domain-containing protein n=1 Tax=Miscanthus lutarioriparius TaxID=422564 RepID=A0A811S5E4_9POAL|nr:unnamed protein product [Miscanthus lutarioriparius]